MAMTSIRKTLVLIAVMTAVVPMANRAEAAEPFRVGFLAPLTGVLAPAGKDMLEGFQFFYEQVNHQCGARRVEVIAEDTEGNPAVTLAKMRRFLEREKVQVIAGILYSHIGYAVAPVVDQRRIPTLLTTTPDDLTKRKPAKYVIRASWAASQVTHPIGDYAYKVLGYRRAATIALDNAFGYESVSGFQRVFEDHGGQVVQKLWAPINALDLAPYLAQLRRDVDVVFTTFAGAQSLRFAKQYAEAGLKGKLPLVTTGVQMDESVLRSMGDEAVGIINGLTWSPTLKNPANDSFVEGYRAKFGKTPSVYHLLEYGAAKWLCETVKNSSESDGPEQLLKRLRLASETVQDPRGPIRVDEYGNPTQNVYILKVERVGGRLQNTVIHTYPMVSQFWTYKPDEFMKQPPYSRDYPPAKAP